jgi:hypothetical protein
MKLNRSLSVFCTSIAIFAFLPGVSADTVGFLHNPLVDHPVRHPTEIRSASRWKADMGSWGENIAEQTLRLRGFEEIHEVKTRGNQGIDRVAIKRVAGGVIKEVRYVEVKTSRSPKPRLNQTRYGGTQMSRRHLAENLRKMRNSGDPNLRKLAVELGRFRRSSGLTVESMGEVIHIDTKTGLITVYSGDLSTVKSVDSAERMLKRVQRRGVSVEGRRLAARSLGSWGQIRSQDMASYLGKNVAQQAKSAILANTAGSIEAAALRQSRMVLTRKILQRAGGPIAIVVSLAFDAKEVFDTEYAYRTGAISERQRNVRLLTSVGGTAGALAMAPVGGVAGMWIGAFGGPFAWITVPVGGFVGATVFGIAGYFGFSAMTEYGASAWYGSIDAAVRERFERYWLATTLPFD